VRVGHWPTFFVFGLGQRPLMDLQERIAEMIAPSLEAMGYDLVRVLLQGQRRPVLQIMAERRDEVAMTVDDCASISRAVSALLDVEDPIQGRYSLEVSSPGIDRPLVRAGDFDRFAGYEAKLETTRLVDGRKRFSGRLDGIVDGVVRLKTDQGIAEVPFADIHRAKLVLTDELIAASLKSAGQEG